MAASFLLPFPFFLPRRVCLLPDERSQRRCSPSSDNFADLNPSFNENFVFQVRKQRRRDSRNLDIAWQDCLRQCVMRGRPDRIDTLIDRHTEVVTVSSSSSSCVTCISFPSAALKVSGTYCHRGGVPTWIFSPKATASFSPSVALQYISRLCKFWKCGIRGLTFKVAQHILHNSSGSFWP